MLMIVVEALCPAAPGAKQQHKAKTPQNSCSAESSAHQQKEKEAETRNRRHFGFR